MKQTDLCQHFGSKNVVVKNVLENTFNWQMSAVLHIIIYFWLINICTFNYSDSWLSGLLSPVPTGLDNWGLTIHALYPFNSQDLIAYTLLYLLYISLKISYKSLLFDQDNNYFKLVSLSILNTHMYLLHVNHFWELKG